MLDQLGFVEAHCEFRQNDADPINHFAWRRPIPPRGSGETPAAAGHYRAGLWNLEIPFDLAGGGNGMLRLARAFDRRAALFRMESLVELVAEQLPPALCARSSHRAAAAPQPASARPLLAAAWKAAAGVRR